MLWTLFLNRGFSAWKDNCDLPQYGQSMIVNFAKYSRINILYQSVIDYALDDAESATIPLPIDIGNAPTEDVVFGMMVKGTVKVTWTGKDVNNSTSLTGYVFCHGTEKYPGILWLQTYNCDKTTGIVITSEQDATEVTCFVGVKCDDDDIRLTNNA